MQRVTMHFSTNRKAEFICFVLYSQAHLINETGTGVGSCSWKLTYLNTVASDEPWLETIHTPDHTKGKGGAAGFAFGGGHLNLCQHLQAHSRYEGPYLCFIIEKGCS